MGQTGDLDVCGLSTVDSINPSLVMLCSHCGLIERLNRSTLLCPETKIEFDLWEIFAAKILFLKFYEKYKKNCQENSKTKKYRLNDSQMGERNLGTKVKSCVIGLFLAFILIQARFYHDSNISLIRTFLRIFHSMYT